MWPWEHVFFAYVFYSIYRHLKYGDSPSGPATVALAFGSVLPDLIDKPLAWQFGIVESGYTVGHSILVTVPLLFGIYLLARRRDRAREGGAFAVGYFLHIVGDVLPISLRRGELYVDHVLWPVVVVDPTRTHYGLTDGVAYHLTMYVQGLVALEVTPVVALQLGSLVCGLLLWRVDGYPGVRTVIDGFGSLVQAALDVSRHG
ncbi:Membrane-bound metal-dependent hydrolase YbcI, DUF457 family [Halalkaliarchaeum sp. AArc-CO]|uniref:metal-dependent hydrolase n=1 Tax=unclassified Halalkaliarchaeum TaxID=2678344 RepID=UPI00217D9591|nr:MULTISPECIES: metal-dependent hydrolase [unclassified Halalkaliarchaeum]MDR5672231.1 metal-dependent hydrolase [Halalkaliarchaeum sp. AArc-GB]UWG50160.1 Membrane-bound metal-dependent hydrolase YbcI, DUF457 family [Halalkaliarchaeum sp. AArc-CO]